MFIIFVLVATIALTCTDHVSFYFVTDGHGKVLGRLREAAKNKDQNVGKYRDGLLHRLRMTGTILRISFV